MEISKEDREKIRKFEEISKGGYYANGKEVTDLHNKVLNTRLSSTNCPSCIKSRISALVDALNKVERQEALEAERKAEENKAKMAAVRAAKTKKKEEE